jgi:hypothetical protein
MRKILIVVALSIASLSIIISLGFYGLYEIARGPGPISEHDAITLLNGCPAFNRVHGRTREAQRIVHVNQTAPSMTNDYEVRFQWHWKTGVPGAENIPFGGSASFEYLNGRWMLVGFEPPVGEYDSSRGNL